MIHGLVVLLLEARVRDAGHHRELLVGVGQALEEIDQVVESRDAGMSGRMPLTIRDLALLRLTEVEVHGTDLAMGLGGWSTGIRAASPRSFTGGAWRCRPRPAGLSGWVTTAATVWRSRRASSVGTANSGVP